MAVAVQTRKWTLRELHRLPDDGNRYELVRGELFVTPPPSWDHETIVARLTAILVPYVQAQGLGHVYHPRAVMRFHGSQVEPDLMVRPPHPDRRGNDSDWTRAPRPILVVEVASPYTRLRDREEKRRLYADAGVHEYWIVDPDERSVTVIRRGDADRVERVRMSWHPASASDPLEFDVAALFDD